MKLATIVAGFCLAQVGLADTNTRPGDKIKPFIETLTAVADATDDLRNAVQTWDGEPLSAIYISNNSSAVSHELEEGIERIRGAKRLHVRSELKLRAPAKRAADSLYGTLQVLADRHQKFEDAAAKPEAHDNLEKNKELAARLNDMIATKLGPIARKAVRKGREQTNLLFDETLEIFAAEEDKNPEEDEKRRRDHKDWPHINPPPNDSDSGSDLSELWDFLFY